LVLQQKVVELVDVIHLQEQQEDLVVAEEVVVVVRLLQVEQQHNLVNQDYQDQQDLEMQVDQEVLVQDKLELVAVELVVLDNQEEFQNRVQLLEEQVKMFHLIFQVYQIQEFTLVVEVVENGPLNPHQIIQVPLDQVVEVQEQMVNQLQLVELQTLVVVEVVQVMVLVYLLQLVMVVLV
jgi:hypothetical protein|tara:strand:- start:53 stop:589 length:537 start_codon:yes stop_codon:yes gene_type:complete